MKMPNELYRNNPQVLFTAIQCKRNTCIQGRGTGKTHGLPPEFSKENMRRMPRSNGALYCNSYTDILVKILPGIVQGWEEMGYKENKHFFIGRHAPPKYRWPQSHRRVMDAKYYVPWFNGAGMHLVSADHGKTNGNNIDWGIIEEARLQNTEKLREFLLTIRGNAQHFGGMSCHGSTLFVSDMPRSSKEKWLLDHRETMDTDIIEAILKISLKLNELYLQLDVIPKSERGIILSEIAEYEKYINTLRKSTNYFATANTFDNVHALGMDVLKNFREMLSPTDFMVSVLNMEVMKLEKGFYPLWDEHVHGYDGDNAQYVDSLNLQYDIKNIHKVKRDSRWDADVDPYRPLDLSADYNYAINSCVIGQQHGKQYRFLNAPFVKAPYHLRELAQEVCRYYAYHQCKEINLVYDNTAVSGNATGGLTYAQEWAKILRDYGWIVRDQYIGQSPQHHTRYKEWKDALTENPHLPDAPENNFQLRYNRGNCAALSIAMAMAPIKQAGDHFYKKDKSSEKDKAVPPEHATHLTECADILLHWKVSTSAMGAGAYLGTSIK